MNFQCTVDGNALGISSPSALAKRYQRLKLVVSIAGAMLSFAFMTIILATGWSVRIEHFAYSFAATPYLALIVYGCVLGVITTVPFLPLSVFSGFILEHRFKLSNQSFTQWVWEQSKGFFVSACFALPLMVIFYFFVKEFGSYWWILFATAMFLFSLVLSRLAPQLIFPLFYSFTPLTDNELGEKITSLCRKTSMNIEGIYSFNLSKTTKKANAAFTGIGKAKRIILGDTLLENFSHDEIETIFAHELGHYTKRHLWKGIAVGAVSLYLGLFLTSVMYRTSLPWFEFVSIDQIAALPLLMLWLSLYSLVTSPIGNAVSRNHEFEADRYAVEQTGKRTAFVSAMQKLAATNLADVSPHPIVEFLFHSHPSIEKRIRAAEAV